MVIWLSGPTGVGKTTMAELLGEAGYSVIREYVSPDLFADFEKDPERFCSRLQEALMRSRHDQWRALPNHKKIVFDRSLDEDFSVFCRMHRRSGIIDDEALQSLRDICNELQESMPAPNLIVYLFADPETLTGRIDSHPQVVRDHLATQLELYEEWISGRNESVVKLDISKCRLEELINAF